MIPAHDGAATIHRSLGSLAAQDFAGAIEAVVVCNGCRDATHARACEWIAAFERPNRSLRVVESDPGRTTAINAGEALLSEPDVVAIVDQDARLDPHVAAELTELLSTGGTRFAAPRLDLPRSRGIVHRYYAAWQSLPYVSASPVTIGCYAVSSSGRGRWRSFPAGVPDDKFARMQFAHGERAITPTATYSVVLPRDVRSLLRARRTYSASNRSLEAGYPRLAARARGERRTGLLAWAALPRHWIDAPLVIAVHLAAKLADAGGS